MEWNAAYPPGTGPEHNREKQRNNWDPAELWLSQQRLNCKLILGEQGGSAAAAAGRQNWMQRLWVWPVIGQRHFIIKFLDFTTWTFAGGDLKASRKRKRKRRGKRRAIAAAGHQRQGYKKYTGLTARVWWHRTWLGYSTRTLLHSLCGCVA